MAVAQHAWVIVLAGGDGRRLRSGAGGELLSPIPKQYRRLDGRGSMLRWAVRRALTLVPRERVVVVVARDHRRWWKDQLADMPIGNVVIQPRNRGTAAGILLPLMVVLAGDPEADVLILPSDHHVRREELLRDALKEAMAAAHLYPAHVILVGVRPTSDTADYGWIVPLESLDDGPVRTVSAFREKPDGQTVERLLACGAVVNSLMVASRGRALLHLFGETAPDLVGDLGGCFIGRSVVWSRLETLYEGLPSFDFSRRILEPKPERLLVHQAPADCGWSDLGTPTRLQSYFDRRPGMAA